MKRARILVVEDEAITAMDLEHTLSRLGYDVPRTVATGADALQAVDELDIDLVLFDIVLRGPLDGIETAEILRRKHHVPVVFLTAYADLRTIERARAAEPYGYLVKPFHGEELRTTIETALLRADLERMQLENELRHRDLSARLETAREEERASVAREIHDELGQSLTFIRFELAWVKSHPQMPDEEVRKRADGLMGVVEGALQTVRRIATSLRPPILDEGGLGAAVEWQCAEFEERTGIPCRCASLLPEEVITCLGTAPSTVLFRILQESLTNISKHAQASEVHVQLDVLDDSVRLCVCDDGIGLKAPQGQGRRTLGILGMRERAVSCGGTVEVRSGPEGKGTEVVAVIPLARGLAPASAS